MRATTKFYFLLAVFFLLGSNFSWSQSDTISVKVTEFSDGLDNRRGWRDFPPAENSYRQILMYQKLKCDPELISNPTGSGCAEWDYGENYYVFDHRYQDSLRYRLAHNYPDSIAVSFSPTYTDIENEEEYIVYDEVISETTVSFGAGVINADHILKTSIQNGHGQFIYRADELTGAGLVAGSIDKISIDISSLGVTTLSDLTIRLGHTALTELSSSDFEIANLNVNYQRETEIIATGVHTFELTYAFEWDGVSNIVVDFSFSNNSSGADFQVLAHDTPYNSGVYANQDDGYFEFNDDFVNLDVEELKTMIDSNITISFWSKADIEKFDGTRFCPFNALDADDLYILLAAIPNGDGVQATWWAGRNGGLDAVSYSEYTDPSEYDSWDHWTFTRDAGAVLNIYRNGELLFSDVRNADRIMNTFVNFQIGSDRYSQGDGDWFYYGGINEFQIWNRALDAATINDWMYRDITAAHPNYENLVCNLRFDEPGNTTAIDEVGIANGTPLGLPEKRYMHGNYQFRNLVETTERPNIVFVQGEYESHIETETTTISVENSPISIVVSENIKDVELIGMQDNPLDTIYGIWPAESFETADMVYYNWYKGKQIEIIKYITPYGNYLDLGEGFTWIHDVTEFKDLLTGSVDLLGGGSGELLDLEFKFITGTPPQDVISWEYLDNVRGQYDDIVNNPTNYYNVVHPHVDGEKFGIRGSFSGHGFSNPTNCSEFCQRTHFLNVDGETQYEWIHWKECADNPLYPQGGTWIYDRTGWCPGAPQDIYHFDLTSVITPGVESIVFKGVEDDPTGEQYGTWGGFMYFLSYTEPNFVTDGTVYDIISPSDHDEYQRFNPVCDNAQIVIRNNGSATMTSATIKYNIEGGIVQTYEWTGSLEFMETETITLPMNYGWCWTGDERRFNARISMVNGVVDDYADNDANFSYFTPAPMHESELEIRFKANNMGGQSSWNIVNGFGDVLYEETDFEANEMRETALTLPDGCYVFNVYDTGDNGLSFWADDEGSGYCQMRKASGGLLMHFDSDFGDNIRYEFSVGGTVAIDELDIEAKLINVFPNPSSGIYNLALDNFDGNTISIEVYDMLGKRVMGVYDILITETHYFTKLNLEMLSSGFYNIVLSSDEEVWTEQVRKN